MMMPKTERNSYHTPCAGTYVHVYVGVRASIVTNLCKGQCPIVAVHGEFVSPIYPSRGLAPITVTLPLRSLFLSFSLFHSLACLRTLPPCDGNQINTITTPNCHPVFGERPSVSGNSRRTGIDAPYMAIPVPLISKSRILG